MEATSWRVQWRIEIEKRIPAALGSNKQLALTHITIFSSCRSFFATLSSIRCVPFLGEWFINFYFITFANMKRIRAKSYFIFHSFFTLRSAKQHSFSRRHVLFLFNCCCRVALLRFFFFCFVVTHSSLFAIPNMAQNVVFLVMWEIWMYVIWGKYLYFVYISFWMVVW